MISPNTTSARPSTALLSGSMSHILKPTGLSSWLLSTLLTPYWSLNCNSLFCGASLSVRIKVFLHYLFCVRLSANTGKAVLKISGFRKRNKSVLAGVLFKDTKVLLQGTDGYFIERSRF